MYKATKEVSGITINLGDFKNEATRDRVLEIYDAFFSAAGRYPLDLSDRLAFGMTPKAVEKYAQQAILDKLLLGA